MSAVDMEKHCNELYGSSLTWLKVYFILNNDSNPGIVDHKSIIFY